MADDVKKPGKMVRYISTEPTTHGGAYAPAGTPFVTDADPLPNWQKIDATEKAAIEAADKLNTDDLDLDALDLAALKGLAASKKLNVGDAKTKDDYKTIIRAANEPAL
jgi:hypothetical protein